MHMHMDMDMVHMDMDMECNTAYYIAPVIRAAHDAEAHCASSKMHAWSVAFASRCMVLELHRVRICI